MKKRNKVASDFSLTNPNDNVKENKEYGLSDLNWKDDGDVLQDPSMNDYLKGYQMEPYEFKQYASINKLYKVAEGDSLGSISVFANKTIKELYELNGFNKETVSSSKHLKVGSYLIVDKAKSTEKVAAKEVRDISYTPENLAKEILSIWSQVDGPLQNFYDGFTMNKMDNKLKISIANILKEWGYEVYPTLTTDKPIYASAYQSFKKIAALKDPIEIMDKVISTIASSKTLEDIRVELINTAHENNGKVSLAEAGGLIDYYKQIFPEDYAVSLVSNAIDKPNMSFDEFNDIQLSDESLEQMEKMDSGNQKPLGNPNNGGMGGFDFSTQMRSDSPGGVAPTSYETRANKIQQRIVESVKKK